MSEMPNEEKRELTRRFAAISTEEILQDIADTEAEIAMMERELPHFQALGELGDRMMYLRASARCTGIRDRKAFIERLRRILEARGVN